MVHILFYYSHLNLSEIAADILHLAKAILVCCFVLVTKLVFATSELLDFHKASPLASSFLSEYSCSCENPFSTLRSRNNS